MRGRGRGHGERTEPAAERGREGRKGTIQVSPGPGEAGGASPGLVRWRRGVGAAGESSGEDEAGRQVEVQVELQGEVQGEVQGEGEGSQGRSEMEVRCGLISTVVFVVLLVSSILIALSFGVLQSTESGIDYNTITQSLDTSKVWSNGRHFIGLGHEFIVFPTNLVTISFPSEQCRTSDGLLVTLSIEFQYQLVGGDTLFELYADWGTEYDAGFRNIAKDSIRNVAASFTAFDFFERREAISAAMQVALHDKLTTSHHATVELFQLQNIDLPIEFQDSIQATEIARQEIQRVINVQNQEVINAQTKIIEAEASAQILTVQAENEAAGYVAQKGAEAYAIGVRLSAEKDAYSAIKATLNFTNEELLSYVWVKNLEHRQDSEAGKLVMKIPQPANLG